MPLLRANSPLLHPRLSAQHDREAPRVQHEHLTSTNLRHEREYIAGAYTRSLLSPT